MEISKVGFLLICSKKAMGNKFRYYIFFILHLVVIFFVWLSPFLFNWRVVVLGAVIYPILGLFFRACPITVWQFGSAKFGFYEYYFRKIGLKLSRKTAIFIVRFAFPLLILLLSIYLQIILKVKPIII